MKKSFRLVGLDCANCAAKIERDVQKLPGVEKAVVSLMTTRMTIEADESKMEEITQKAVAIVNKYEPDVVVKRG
ncbi:MAG: cation transporter [Acutalibacteraceae bacterium]